MRVFFCYACVGRNSLVNSLVISPNQRYSALRSLKILINGVYGILVLIHTYMCILKDRVPVKQIYHSQLLNEQYQPSIAK